MPEPTTAVKTFADRFREVRAETNADGTPKYSDDAIVAAMEVQGFSDDDYELPLEEAQKRAGARLVAREVTKLAKDTASSLSLPARVTSEAVSSLLPKSTIPTVSTAVRKLAAEAAKAPVEPALDLPLGAGTNAETTAVINSPVDKMSDTQPVSVTARLGGVVTGAGKALLSPIESTEKGFADAKLDTEMKIASKSVPSRVVDDIRDTVMGIPKMLGTLVEPLPEGTDEFAYGKDIGKAVTEGALGGTAYQISHPVESFQATPVSALSVFAPLTKSIAVGAKGLAPVQRILSAADKVGSAVTQEVVNALPTSVVDAANTAATKYKQAFVRSTEQESPLASGVAEELRYAGKGKTSLYEGEFPVPEASGPGPELAIRLGTVHTVSPERAEKAKKVIEKLGEFAEEQKRAVALERQRRAAVAAGEDASKIEAQIPAADRRMFAAMTEEDMLDAEGLQFPAAKAPSTKLANVFTSEQAKGLAGDILPDKTKAPSSVEAALAARLEKAYKANPEAPLPTVTASADVGLATPETRLPPQRAVRNVELFEKEAKAADVAEMAANLSPAGVAETRAGKELASAGTAAGLAGFPKVVAGINQAGLGILDTADTLLTRAAKGELPPLLSLTKEELSELVPAVAARSQFNSKVRQKLIDHLEDMQEAQPGAYMAKGVKEAIADPVTKQKWLDQAANFIKGSLTVYNPVSGVNNFVSNLSFKIARAGNPITPVLSLIGTAKTLMSPSPAEAKAVKYWTKSGLLDGTALGNDVAAATGMASAVRFGPVGKALEKFYAGGDNLGKVDEALGALNKYGSFYKKLADGEWLDLEISPNVKARLVGGSDKVDLIAGNKVIKKIGLDEALYRAAERQAKNNYMDYGEVPGVAKWFRENGGALSTISPFTTWFLKSLDMPGKKGLLYRTVFDTDREILGTNSPRVSMSEQYRLLGTAAMRAAYFNGLRNVLKEESDPALQEAVAFAPTQAKLALVRELANPDYLSVQSFGNWNYLGATELLARTAIQAYGMADNILSSEDTPEAIRTLALTMQYAAPEGRAKYASKRAAQDAEIRSLIENGSMEEAARLRKEQQRMDVAMRAANGITPEERAAYMRNKEFQTRMQTKGYATTNDALNLIQLAGTSALEVIDQLREAGEVGKTLDTGKLVTNTVIPLAFGGFGKGIVKSVAEAVRRSGATGAVGDVAMTAAPKAQEDIELYEKDYLRFLIKTFTGVGWQKLPLDKISGEEARSFFNKAEKEWKSALGTTASAIAALENEIEVQRELGNLARVKELEARQARAEDIEEVIETEIAQFESNLEAAIKAVSVKKLPKVSK